MSHWFRQLNRRLFPTADVPSQRWISTHRVGALYCGLGLLLCGVSIWWQSSNSQNVAFEDGYTATLDALVASIDEPGSDSEKTQHPAVESRRSSVAGAGGLQPAEGTSSTAPGPQLRVPADADVRSLAPVRSAVMPDAHRVDVDHGSHRTGQVRLSKYDTANRSVAGSEFSLLHRDGAWIRDNVLAGTPAWLAGTIETQDDVPATPLPVPLDSDGPQLMLRQLRPSDARAVSGDSLETSQNRR